MPLVVPAELLFGVEKSSRREQNRARLQRFAAGVRVLPFDVAVAARYAAVRAEVERKGRSKTDFDEVFGKVKTADLAACSVRRGRGLCFI